MSFGGKDIESFINKIITIGDIDKLQPIMTGESDKVNSRSLYRVMNRHGRKIGEKTNRLM